MTVKLFRLCSVRSVSLLLFTFLLASPVQAAVSSSPEGTAVIAGNDAGGSVALNCGTNDNRFVFVAAGVNDATNQISGITYNGVALSQLGSKLAVGTRVNQVFYLPGAASGSKYFGRDHECVRPIRDCGVLLERGASVRPDWGGVPGH
jgi:hypothetical protein